MTQMDLDVAAASSRRLVRVTFGRMRLLALIAVAAVGALAAPALAAHPTIQVNPNPVHRGKLVRVHGVVPGCSGTVTLISRAFSHAHEFAGVPAVFAHVGRHHRYSVRTRIPARRSPGRYRISGRCGGANLGVSAMLHVLS